MKRLVTLFQSYKWSCTEAELHKNEARLRLTSFSCILIARGCSVQFSSLTIKGPLNDFNKSPVEYFFLPVIGIMSQRKYAEPKKLKAYTFTIRKEILMFDNVFLKVILAEFGEFVIA